MKTHTPRSARACERTARAGSLLAAALLAFAPTLAEARCASVADESAFEIEALKTELMVVATTCKGPSEDRYNDFVRRYQPTLLQANKNVAAYFARRGGPRQNDFFITELANARSNEARQLGGDFCSRNSGLFSEVMALSGPADLAPYAATKDLLSSSVSSCSSGSSASTAAAAPPTRTASKPKKK
jgi:hypothetical protein